MCSPMTSPASSRSLSTDTKEAGVSRHSNPERCCGIDFRSRIIRSDFLTQKDSHRPSASSMTSWPSSEEIEPIKLGKGCPLQRFSCCELQEFIDLAWFGCVTTSWHSMSMFIFLLHPLVGNKRWYNGSQRVHAKQQVRHAILLVQSWTSH